MRRSIWRNSVSVLRFSSSVMTGMRSRVCRAAARDLVVNVVSTTWCRGSIGAAIRLVRRMDREAAALFEVEKRPKIDGESNLGQQSQSIEPPRETSATERVQPMAA